MALTCSHAACLPWLPSDPFDYVKTQLQTREGRGLYANAREAFTTIAVEDGPLALYRGVGVQVAGVAPEKALKLTVNDAARTALAATYGELTLVTEVAAGVAAGTCQVLVTNPLEIVKVRLQTDRRRLSVMETLREIGFVGLYQGAAACALRDASFSAILFPCYSHLKVVLPETLGALELPSVVSLFCAGVLSAAPAALLTTPFDVIKTRLQVVDPVRRRTGPVDACRAIVEAEGTSKSTLHEPNHGMRDQIRHCIMARPTVQSH